MFLLEVEPMDLGADVKAVGLELIEPQSREPVQGEDAARIWSRAVATLAAEQALVFDFFSHVERVRDYCRLNQLVVREATTRCLVLPAPSADATAALLQRFAGETFGARAGAAAAAGDAELEAALSQRGVDGYHHTFAKYYFCGVCDLENGFLTLLTNRLWAGEVARRLTPALIEYQVKVQVPV
jgi:hypothetical protein